MKTGIDGVNTERGTGSGIMTEEMKYMIDSLRDINYFDCVDRPSHTIYEINKAADCLEEVVEELEVMESKLSELLCYITGGRFSKTGYDINDMKRFVDDYLQDTCNNCNDIKELQEELESVKGYMP